VEYAGFPEQIVGSICSWINWPGKDPVEYGDRHYPGEAANIPAGASISIPGSFDVKTSGKYSNVGRYRGTVVFNANGKIVLAEKPGGCAIQL